MTFPGTELLEVAPDWLWRLAVGSGGGKVFAIGAAPYGASGYAAIMDTTTGASLLYSIPVYSGQLGISVHADYQAGKAWVASSSSWIAGNPCQFASITTSGVTWTSGTWGPAPYSGSYVLSVLACGDYIHGSATIGASWSWGRLDQTTGTASTVSSGSFSDPPIKFAGAVGSTIYDSLGTTTLTAWNDKRDTPGSTWTLPFAPISAGVTVGTKIWWQASTGMVSFDTATNTPGGTAATPGTGYPSSGERPTVLGDVAYWTHSDNTKLVAFHLPTGQWKLDDLVTARAGRHGVGVGNGKLWIPSTVTPP